MSVQDPAGWLLVRLLDLPEGGAGARVLDLCAAPGGKSSLILSEWPQAWTVASDLGQVRMSQLQDLEDRQGIHVSKVVADGRKPPFVAGQFTHVLVDAPCSNLGTVRRRPEALWKADLAGIKRNAKLQRELLEGAAALLAPGGVLVYGTCSPEPEETLEVVDGFLADHLDWGLENARNFLASRYTFDRCLRIIPAPGSLDGFFGARLVRLAEPRTE